jgi:hypothetical protein
MLSSRPAGTIGTPRTTTLPRDADAMDGHDRHHHIGVGQDLSGPVGLERHPAQYRSEGIAAVPQPPG